MRVGKAARWMLCILAVMLSLSFAAAESANEAGRWELEANQMDQYLDHAFEEYLAGIEEKVIRHYLALNGGNITRTAKDLGMLRQNLQHKLKKYE